MFRYEMKKIFGRTGSRAALALFAAILCLICWFAARNFSYANEAGDREYGIAAVRKMRAAQKAWAGTLDEAKLRAVIEENLRIAATPEAQSEDVRQRNIAYGWQTGIQEILNLLNASFAKGFRSYDGYRADSLTPDDASEFYANRVALLKTWLAEQQDWELSEAENAYLIRQYERLETPFEYDYMHGWTRLFRYMPSVTMISALFLSYLVAGIFSNEHRWRADAVFFSSRFGRSRATASKVCAGFVSVSALYWVAVLLFTGFVLAYYGADGALCPIQADLTGWKCYYNITNLQKYLLMAFGGYVGNLALAGLTMLASVCLRSSLVAVTVPFVLIFEPSLLLNLGSQSLEKISGLLPESLMDIEGTLSYFSMLYNIGGRIVPAIPLLFALYSALTVLLAPALYQIYRRKEII